MGHFHNALKISFQHNFVTHHFINFGIVRYNTVQLFYFSMGFGAKLNYEITACQLLLRHS
ncbi:hypothetical protein CW304_04715 [Bacillus sp. UFRGS-B20]|nr:hypothetical protein CW304_04715 [Bacillus sp. UFRGS-B20]